MRPLGPTLVRFSAQQKCKGVSKHHHEDRVRDAMDVTGMADRLWHLSDAVTAFAILQSLAFLYALARSDIASRLVPFVRQVIIGTLIIVTLECVAVVGLALLGTGIIDDTEHIFVWWWVTAGRVVAILAFSAVILYFLVPATRGSPQESKAERSDQSLSSSLKCNGQVVDS